MAREKPADTTDPTPRGKPRLKGLSGFAVRLPAGYLACLVAATLFPTAFPRAVIPLFKYIQNQVLPGSITTVKVSVDRNLVAFDCETTALTPFRDVNNRPVPTYSFDGHIQTDVLNVYPVIALALLLAWPLSARVRITAALVLLPLLALAAALDLLVMLQWTHAKSVAAIWTEISGQIPATPENAGVFDSIQAGVDRLARWKSFISTGGRPFAAAMLAMAAIGLAEGLDRFRILPRRKTREGGAPPTAPSPRKRGS